MLLSKIRRAVGTMQAQVAATLGIKQPTLSRLESQDDMQISTLDRLIRALDGELEIIAPLPNGTIRIRQFEDAARLPFRFRIALDVAMKSCCEALRHKLAHCLVDVV